MILLCVAVLFAPAVLGRDLSLKSSEDFGVPTRKFWTDGATPSESFLLSVVIALPRRFTHYSHCVFPPGLAMTAPSYGATFRVMDIDIMCASEARSVVAARRVPLHHGSARGDVAMGCTPFSYPFSHPLPRDCARDRAVSTDPPPGTQLVLVTDGHEVLRREEPSIATRMHFENMTWLWCPKELPHSTFAVLTDASDRTLAMSEPVLFWTTHTLEPPQVGPHRVLLCPCLTVPSLCPRLVPHVGLLVWAFRTRFASAFFVAVVVASAMGVRCLWL